MDGEVIGMRNEKCAVRIDSGVTIFKILCPHDTDLGDVISGDLESLGSGKLVNKTRGKRLDVFIEDWGCATRTADLWLRR